MSKPLGRGLSLHEMPPGELIFFAGGTGINPFCDVIDIMFK
jgi:ferredoxin-NADP reductase